VKITRSSVTTTKGPSAWFTGDVYEHVSDEDYGEDLHDDTARVS
jgi:hypothetical protein